MTLEELDNIHKDLRKYKYFYYEKDESLISDYDFDMLETLYKKWCAFYNIPKEYTLNNYVGFSLGMPMSLLSFKNIKK